MLINSKNTETCSGKCQVYFTHMTGEECYVNIFVQFQFKSIVTVVIGACVVEEEHSKVHSKEHNESKNVLLVAFLFCSE